MPHTGERRPQVEDASSILASRAFAPRPRSSAAAASATVVVDDADLVMAGRSFASRSSSGAAASGGSAAIAIDADVALGIRSFMPRPQASTAAASSSGSGMRFTAANSPPVSPAPVAGDEWVDGDTGILFKYYNDGTSSQWVEF